MTHLFELLGLLACLIASAAYSGSETGYYSLNRTRVQLEAHGGRRSARHSVHLLRDEAALLITILIGNNLFLELAAHMGDGLLSGWILSAELRALSVTAILTPLVFLFGEALPKELFRRRPHTWTARTTHFMHFSRVAYWPLQRMLRVLSWVLERVFGISEERVHSLQEREVVFHMLAEGARSGAFEPHAETLALNALELRTTPISTCMVPWEDVLVLRRGQSEEELRATVMRSSWSRLPVVGADGGCEGYVHQIDVLSAAPETEVLAKVLPLAQLAPETPVDAALRTLRGTGRRIALVQEAGASEPQGILTLKDLVEEISGELAGW